MVLAHHRASLSAPTATLNVAEMPTVVRMASCRGHRRTGQRPEHEVVDATSRHRRAPVALLILGSGFPGMRHLTGTALTTQLDGYLDRIADRDLVEVGLRVRRPATFKAWLRAYLGQLFESLATLSVRVFAGSCAADVSHLRLDSGRREVDVIAERTEDGAVVAFEVKLSADVGDDDVKHLVWLREQLGDQFADGAVLTTAEHAYRRPDGIAVVPLGLLGP